MSENTTKEPTSVIKNRKLTAYDILRLIFSHWYWFAISIIICMLGAGLYLRHKAPTYRRTATVLVKDSRKGSSSEVTAFNDLMGGIGRRSVDNEIHIFESRHLMEQVVLNNELTTRYTTRGRIRTTDLYGRTPMLVHFIDGNNNISGQFTYTMTPAGEAHIDGFNDEPGFSATVTPGDTVATPLGNIVMELTPYFDRYNHLEVTVSKMALNDATEIYRSKLSCDIADKQASVITLTMVDEVPKRAEDVINGIIEAYDIDAIEDKRAISDITAAFINDRLVTLGQELSLADSEIAAFKQEYRLYNLDDAAQISATEIQRLNQSELSLEANLEMAEYIMQYISDTDQELSLIPASTVTLSGASAALVSQIDLYNRNVLDYQRLSSETSQSNPVLLDLSNQIANVRSSIVASLESHIGGLELQLEQISREQQIADRRMENSPAMEMELLSIARQQKVKEELYIYLLTKLEENALTGATAESNARVIDHAYGSNRPVSPHRSMIYLIAMILGVAIPFALLYLREILDTKIRSRRELEKALTIPFLGDIPHFDRKDSTNGGIAVKEDGRDAVSEAFRILRTNMNFMSVNNTVQVVMLTSSTPHSGKTFVSSNLAATIANTGRRVLLMDIDLRRRTLSKQMGHRNDRRGLTSYLTSSISSLSDVIIPSDIEKLDMLFAGPQPPNPTELLMSSRLDELFAELRTRYDYIIIDSVPAMAVADAVTIDRVVDLTIYVIRQGLLDYRQLPDVERLYTEKRFHNMAMVLNDVTNKKSDGYGYGYGYGYYSDEDEMSQWQRRWKSIKRLFTPRKH